MADQTIYGPDGFQKLFTHGTLSQITLQLTSSTQSWVQLDDEIVALRLDNVGRILLMKVSWFPNRRAFETHIPSYDSSMPFNIRWTLIGLSSYVGTSAMFTDLGFANLTISSLADVYMLFFENVPPRSRMTSVDDSTTLFQAIRKQNITNNLKQTHYDGASEEHLTMTVKKSYITQQFDSGILVNNVPASKVELAGMYLIDAGDGQTVTIGPSSTRPIITMVGAQKIGLQVGDTWTEPGVSAQDADGNPLAVVTSGTVTTANLGAMHLVYSAVDAHGNVAKNEN